MGSFATYFSALNSSTFKDSCFDVFLGSSGFTLLRSISPLRGSSAATGSSGSGVWVSAGSSNEGSSATLPESCWRLGIKSISSSSESKRDVKSLIGKLTAFLPPWILDVSDFSVSKPVPSKTASATPAAAAASALVVFGMSGRENAFLTVWGGAAISSGSTLCAGTCARETSAALLRAAILCDKIFSSDSPEDSFRRPNRTDGRNAAALKIIFATRKKTDGDFLAAPASSFAASTGLSTNTTITQNKNRIPTSAKLPNMSRKGFNALSKTTVPNFPPHPKGQKALCSPEVSTPP